MGTHGFISPLPENIKYPCPPPQNMCFQGILPELATGGKQRLCSLYSISIPALFDIGGEGLELWSFLLYCELGLCTNGPITREPCWNKSSSRQWELTRGMTTYKASILYYGNYPSKLQHS